MSWIRRLGTSLTGARSRERRIAEELAFHIEARTAENIAAGMDPLSARLDAQCRFGARARLQEETRDVSVLEWADSLVRDVRLAGRSLLRRPGIAGTILLSLGIGIGATSAIFSVIDSVLLQPFHITKPEQVYALEETRHGAVHNGNPMRLADWTQQSSSFSALCGYYGEGLTMTGQGAPERVRTWRTLGDPLAILGVQPSLGRSFTARELRGVEPVALLDHAFWKSRFNADPQMLGKSLTLGGRGYVVIGILPEEVDYPGDMDALIPAPPDVQSDTRQASFLGEVARLKDGASVGAAQVELSTIAGRLRTQYPATDSGLEAHLIPLRETTTREARKPLLILLATVGVVLLMACVNTASLLLSRASERSRESTVRVALGAGRGSLVRLYLIESLTLAAGGGVLGIALAWLTLDGLVRLLPPDLPRLTAVHLNLRVAGVSFAAALLCGLLFGIFPALHAARSAVNAHLLDRLRSRRLLVVCQIALSTILLVGVGLLGRSLLLMLRTPLGFEPSQVTTVQVNLPWDTDSDTLNAFYSRTLDALAAIPGVRSAGVIDRLPLHGGTQSGRIAIRGVTLPPELAATAISYRGISPGFFPVLRVPLQSGRLLHDRTSDQQPREILVNQTLARQYFGGANAVGQFLTLNLNSSSKRTPIWYQVVGVVGDVRVDPAESSPVPQAYLLMRDVYWPLANFVLRSDGDVRAAVRDVMTRVNPDQVSTISTLDRELSGTVREPRIRLMLTGFFAVTALLLAAVGLYGLLASDVSQRTKEIGIRIALGADSSSILWGTVRRGLRLVLLGLAAGWAGAALFTSYLSSLLYLIQPHDITTLIVAAITLLVVGVGAAYLPARRAARIAPVVALRHE